jgi:hypothetical protein
MARRRKKRKGTFLHLRMVSSKVKEEVLDPLNPYSGVYVRCPLGAGVIKGRGLVGRKIPALSCVLKSKGMVLSRSCLGLESWLDCMGCKDWKAQADSMIGVRKKRRRIEPGLSPKKKRRTKIKIEKTRRAIPVGKERRKIPWEPKERKKIKLQRKLLRF